VIVIERTGPRWACQDNFSLKSEFWESICQQRIFPSLCPLHTNLFPSSATKQIAGEVQTDSRNGALSSSPLLTTPSPPYHDAYRSLKFQNRNPRSVADHNCDSVATMVRKNRPIWVSRKGWGRNSREGGREGCTAARRGGLKIPAPPPLAMNSGRGRWSEMVSLRSRNWSMQSRRRLVEWIEWEDETSSLSLEEEEEEREYKKVRCWGVDDSGKDEEASFWWRSISWRSKRAERI